MKIHPDALRQIIRAMEKDLQKEMPASRAVTERKNHETEFEAITVYHKPARLDHIGADRCGVGRSHDRDDLCGIDPARGSVV